jgi:hypothetical protein
MSRKCSTHGSDTNVYNVLADKPQRKIPLVRFRHSWKNNIKMGLKERSCDNVGLTGQESLAGTYAHCKAPSGCLNGGGICCPVYRLGLLVHEEFS